MTTLADVIVIGSGVAGLSAAAELAELGTVIVLEAEAHAGQHSTGRSAATFIPTYEDAVAMALAKASRPTFDAMASRDGVPVLRPRPYVRIATPRQLGELELQHARLGAAVERIDARALAALAPALSPTRFAAGLVDTGAADLDVALIMQSCEQRLRAAGGRLVCSAPVVALDRQGSVWRVAAGSERFEAPIVVNAAGAWAGDVAARARLPLDGLEPRRRTAILIDPPDGSAISDWAFVTDIGRRFYFKPDAGLVMVSPVDETPSLPGDVQADELDVAVAAHRYEEATGTAVHRIRRRWAGLRTFTPDRAPLIGPDPRAPGFIWSAAYGGHGVQSAPAAARLVRAGVTGGADPIEAAVGRAVCPGRYLRRPAPARRPRAGVINE